MIGPELVNVFLFVAAGGVALLFARDWTVKLAGALLVLPRLLAAPLTDGEVIIFGCGFAAAVTRVVYGWSYGPPEALEAMSEADAPEADDVSEPAACVACRGLIPAGADTCPACGWSYTAPDRNAT